MDIVRKNDISADNGMLDAGCPFDQAGLFARQIVDPFGWLRTDRLRIENNQVRVEAHRKTAFPGLIEKPGRFGGQAAHAFFKRQGLALSHPLSEQIGRHPGVAMLVHMRSGIGQPDEAVGMGD